MEGIPASNSNAGLTTATSLGGVYSERYRTSNAEGYWFISTKCDLYVVSSRLLTPNDTGFSAGFQLVVKKISPRAPP